MNSLVLLTLMLSRLPLFLEQLQRFLQSFVPLVWLAAQQMPLLEILLHVIQNPT